MIPQLLESNYAVRHEGSYSRMTIKSLLQIIFYILSALSLLIALLAVLAAWSMWNMPTTITTGSLGGAMAMELGKDHTSPFLFSFAGVMGVFAFVLFISTKLLLKTEQSNSIQERKNE